MRLIDKRTPDGSRHFACLPQAAAWEAIGDHARLLPGAEMLHFVGEGPGGPWFDFRFRRQRFLVNACDGHVRLFVDDPQCQDLLLYEVGCHFERLLSKPT